MMRKNRKRSIVILLLMTPILSLQTLFASTSDFESNKTSNHPVSIKINESQQQPVRIMGTVVDGTTGEPVIGASVYIKGTSTGTATDLDGKFSLDGPANATLQISYLGYKTKEVSNISGKEMAIQLLEDTQTLDEIVVVGYGTQKKSSLTGAMQALNEKALTNITTPRVENMLNGKAPGVFVVAGSGQPGAQAKVVIRGKNSLTQSTDPLWVIDGVIVGNSSGDLNPDDIESLSVLKDAASTAIYGSQGSNGVIVVTTKRGKSGKATVNVSAKMGISNLYNGNLKMMDGSQLYDLYSSFSNPEKFNQNSWWTPELRNRNFDWWDNATQTGFTQDYNISFSGGTDKLNTFLSLGVYDENGAVKGYDYTRYSARFNMNYQILDWLTIKPQISATLRDIKDQQHSTSAMYNNMPWDSAYLPNGSLVGLPPQTTWVNTTGTNYMYDLQWNYSTSKNYEILGNFDFDIRLTDWLMFSSVNNYKFGEYTEMKYVDPRSSSGESNNGSVENIFKGYNRIYANQLLRFNKIFDTVHSFNGILAYEWNEYNGDSTDAIAAGIPPGFIVGSASMVPNKVDGSKNQWAVQSYFANVNYAYSSRYLAQASFRRDGASNFGKNSQYGNFFSVSAGWNISEESFFDIKFINNLKLRGSYGSTGSRPDALYPQYGLYSVGKSAGYNEQPGALISQLRNDDLTWEKTFTGNLGLDVSFIDRINVTFDIYKKNTSNVLYKVPLPGVTGLTGIYRNVGEVSNKGFELAVNADIIRNKDLRWTVDANIGLNRNKVTKLYGDMEQIIINDGSGIAGSASKLLKPGLDMDSWYLPEWAGVNPDNGSPQWYATDSNGNRVLTSTYADASKTPVTIGSYTPDYFGGFSTSLSYKGIDFSAVFNYSVGGKIYNYSRSEYDSDGTYNDRNQMVLMKGWSRWEKAGDIATHPLPSYDNKSQSNNVSSRFLEDGSFLKMKSLTLGYTIPAKIWEVSNLRVYFSGENLFTITDYSGVDPEIPPRLDEDAGTISITGVSTAVYPSIRRFMFGLNITF